MEFYYFCTTCVFQRRDPNTKVIYDNTKMWCALHSKLLPIGPGSKDVICCDYSPSDPRATEFKEHIKKFPEGELWSFLMYYPSYKFATIADLQKVDPETGEVVD